MDTNKNKQFTEEEIKKKLTDEQYQITRRAGTESPFENKYHDLDEPGIYVDILSGTPLFSSTQKFHSGTGWPSFTCPLEPENIETKSDEKLFMKRTEVLSKDTGNHLGHLFEDGPTDPDNPDGATPTGLRYCLNSASLKFIPKEKMEEEGYEKYLRLFDK